MGSHSVTRHPTRVNAPRLYPMQPDRPVLDLFTPEGRKAELTLVLDGLPVRRQSPSQVVFIW